MISLPVMGLLHGGEQLKIGGRETGGKAVVVVPGEKVYGALCGLQAGEGREVPRFHM